ncbi:MAG: hypothetical protein ACK55Z_08135 [bacterium]
MFCPQFKETQCCSSLMVLLDRTTMHILPILLEAPRGVPHGIRPSQRCGFT